ncbi:MAG: DegT/DnrJ/EryC1/StrS family aminotransferase [Deltaproteobacteria bacterium]|nr:DegT/DnrJ/EryC1/StrS family aminotransferase [Deltaproteobacteria bacterium]
MKKIPIAQPAFLGNEKEYVKDCMDTQWISSIGKYISQFEETFARWCGTRYAVSCCNGTAALHVALLALGVKPGDEVIVPTLTFVATVNAVTMCGAVPVFVDSESDSWNIDPKGIERAITPKTKGIIPVHLYGYPADMEVIAAIAKSHKLFILEDAAEAHGAEVNDRKVGAWGTAAIFSFFGNKILTTGEGGMVTTDDPALATELKLIRSQGQDSNRRYWFPVVGYNYRMTNIAAAIGLAQIEKVDAHLNSRRAIDHWYRKHLSGVEGIRFQTPPRGAQPICWLFTVGFDNSWPQRDAIMESLGRAGIETRPVFYPIHTLPPYQKPGQLFPVAERLAASGMNLPTWHGLTEADVIFICKTLKEIKGSLRIAA